MRIILIAQARNTTSHTDMEFVEKPMSYFIERLASGQSFSLPGFSDAEWIAMLQRRQGEITALGQEFTAEIGARLEAAFQSHREDETYMRAVPKALRQIGPIADDVDSYIKNHGMETIPLYERDLVTDDLAEKAKLWPFINQLRQMRTVVVSHAAIRGIRWVLHYDAFIEISTPNFHKEDGGIERVVEECIDVYKKLDKPVVFLFSAGMSAAAMIHLLHDRVKGSYLIDVGSMWDAFCGVGEQRTWRAKLYADPVQYEHWVLKNTANHV